MNLFANQVDLQPIEMSLGHVASFDSSDERWDSKPGSPSKDAESSSAVSPRDVLVVEDVANSNENNANSLPPATDTNTGAPLTVLSWKIPLFIRRCFFKTETNSKSSRTKNNNSEGRAKKRPERQMYVPPRPQHSPATGERSKVLISAKYRRNALQSCNIVFYYWIKLFCHLVQVTRQTTPSVDLRSNSTYDRSLKSTTMTSRVVTSDAQIRTMSAARCARVGEVMESSRR